MGQGESLPLPDAGSNRGYVAISIGRINQVLVLYAPEEVSTGIEAIVREVGGKVEGEHSWYSTVKVYRLPGRPFVVDIGSKSDATLGKLFVLRILEHMYISGYDFLTSSDLSTMFKESTMIFKKIADTEGRACCRIACAAPGGTDKLFLLKHDGHFKQGVIQSVIAIWDQRIQRAEDVLSMGQVLREIKFEGNPWGSPWGSSTREASVSRLMMAKVITDLSKLGWKLHANVNIKGATDSLFFINTPHQEVSTSMITLSRPNVIGLIGSVSHDLQLREALKKCINDNWQYGMGLFERRHYQTYEFKLRGSPFNSFQAIGQDAAIGSRMLLCRIFETLMPMGWAPLSGMDLSKNRHGKTSITMVRCQPDQAQYSCLVLGNSDKIRLIGFPSQLIHQLQDVIRHYWSYGVKSEQEVTAHCYEIQLIGRPWEWYNAWGLHGRALLLRILETATGSGWNHVTSINLSSAVYPNELHTWFFSNKSFVLATPSPSPALSSPKQDTASADNPPNYSEATGHVKKEQMK